MIFAFGRHRIDVERREVTNGGTSVHVEPQVFDLLICLLENRDRVVSKDHLMNSVWGDRIVSESTLTSRINAARKAIGDNGKDQRLIRTIPRKGFLFVGDVKTQEHNSAPATAVAGQVAANERASAVAAERRSIAVLPFTNMSGDRNQEYFSDGISEDIISALSKLRWFLVIARNSSFSLQGEIRPHQAGGRRTRCRLCRRRQCAQCGKPSANISAAERCRHIQPSLGGTLRGQPWRCIRTARRDN